MKAVMSVEGPSGAGPGERATMLERAAGLFEQSGVTETIRIDVPPRGADEAGEGGVLRSGVEPVIPALQSGSLFGDRLGIEVVDHIIVATRGITSFADTGLLPTAEEVRHVA